jgi:hypothetical protein
VSGAVAGDKSSESELSVCNGWIVGEGPNYETGRVDGGTGASACGGRLVGATTGDAGDWPGADMAKMLAVLAAPRTMAEMRRGR